MSKYDIFAISMPNLVELGPIFHSLRHMFPVRLILSGVLVILKLPSLIASIEITTKSLMGQHIVCLIGGHGLLAGSL